MSLSAALSLIAALGSLGQLEPLGEDAATITIEPTDVKFIETRWSETVIRSRPWVPRGRLATLGSGTRLVVRGTVESRDKAGCEGKPWYAVHPYGFVCSRHVKPSREPPGTGRALQVEGERTLPYDYVLVREDGVPMYGNDEEVRSASPSRTLTSGMSLAAGRTKDIDGVAYLETVDGKLVPKEHLGWMGKGSQWSGVAITGEVGPGPAFGWIGRDKTPVYAGPTKESVEPLEKLPYRRRVALTGEALTNDEGRWWPIGEDRWVEASRVNAVIILAPPSDVIRPEQRARGNDQWIDVDVGEQVLVAYRGDTPVFATMVSSGRGSPTPRGNYPIWAKVASMTMGNQGYEDNPYMVEHVPWVLLFQGHNAIHGAYWHDRFGQRRSHGCVNLAPKDARWVFDWVSPPLPEGWTGYLPGDLDRSVTVHVRDSGLPENEAFIQERPVGPPDREAERRKLEEAEARREKARSSEANDSSGEAALAHAPDADAPIQPADSLDPESMIDPEVELPD